MTSRFNTLFDSSNNKNHNIFKTKKNKNRFNLSLEKPKFKNSRFDFDSSEKNIFKTDKKRDNRFIKKKVENNRMVIEAKNRIERNTIFGLISNKITEPQKEEEKKYNKKYPKINKFNRNIKPKLTQKKEEKDLTLTDDDFPPLN
jgi:hypothetical protein